MFPGAYRNLHLMALDPYDLALSKLERNSQKDRDDVRFLARRVPEDMEHGSHAWQWLRLNAENLIGRPSSWMFEEV